MKIAISFICGVVISCLIIFGVKPILPAQAETTASGGESENFTTSLTNLLPDFEKIYRDALTMPFIKAESKIYDPDIAEFYRELMEKTGLTDSGNTPN
jgi:hypothetical protein